MAKIVEKNNLLAKFSNAGTDFLTFLSFNEPSLMTAFAHFTDRLNALRIGQLDLFRKLHGTENEPADGLGFGAAVTWRRPDDATIHFKNPLETRGYEFYYYLKANLPNPYLEANSEFVSALLPKDATNEDWSSFTMARLVQTLHLENVDPDFVASYDDFAARLHTAYTDLDSYLEYVGGMLQPVHVVYMVPHLAAAWGKDHVPEFKRPPRLIKDVNPPATTIRDGARIIASHHAAVSKWRAGLRS